jgi:hypothetical protein
MNVSPRRMRMCCRAATSSSLVPRHVRSTNSPAAGSNWKIVPPSAPESSTARATMVVSTLSRSRLELTAWLISPSASSSSTDRASWRVRRTFWIAIWPCAAKVVTSPIVRSSNGSTLARQSPMTAATLSSACMGTPSRVRKPPSSLARVIW